MRCKYCGSELGLNKITTEGRFRYGLWKEAWGDTLDVDSLTSRVRYAAESCKIKERQSWRYYRRFRIEQAGVSEDAWQEQCRAETLKKQGDGKVTV